MMVTNEKTWAPCSCCRVVVLLFFLWNVVSAFGKESIKSSLKQTKTFLSLEWEKLASKTLMRDCLDLSWIGHQMLPSSWPTIPQIPIDWARLPEVSWLCPAPTADSLSSNNDYRVAANNHGLSPHPLLTCPLSSLESDSLTSLFSQSLASMLPSPTTCILTDHSLLSTTALSLGTCTFQLLGN